MIIEDLHWIDEPSREMLEMAVGAADARAGDDPGQPPAGVPPGVAHQRRAHAAAPAPAARRATSTQIVRALAGGALPAELEERILAKAEGNPFFAEEITRSLIEEGYLTARRRRRRS